MIFSFNDFLMAISTTLDFVEMDLLGITSNHSKRVAYIALKLAKQFNFKKEEQIDIVSLSILHDNGLNELLLKKPILLRNGTRTIKEDDFKEHCIIGEKNIKNFPLHSNSRNIIKYHHEYYDGSGFFKVRKNRIPLMAQILSFADTIDFLFSYQNPTEEKKLSSIEYIKNEEYKKFSPYIVNNFLTISTQNNFWRSLRDENIELALYSLTPESPRPLSLNKISNIMNVFSKIIDSKSHFTKTHSSGLADKIEAMATYYSLPPEESLKLSIAAKLHDIGKLAVPNSILDKPGSLTNEEMRIIQKHALYTKTCLQKIQGFDEITRWASNHHEKLNGNGYPYGLNKQDLDFNSRLMACLDIYQALTEERPYRKPLSHMDAINILTSMSKNNLIDSIIVSDIAKAFNK